MNSFLSQLTLWCALILSIEGRKPIICYWGTWSHYREGNGRFQVTDINGSLCTHIMYTFFGISAQGDIRILDQWLDIDLQNIAKTIALKHNYPDLKVLASVGGWNEGSTKFSQVARNSALRERFAENALNFIDMYGFDGIDIDWEYPGQRGGESDDKDYFTLLLKSVSQLLRPKNYLVMIAAASAEPSASISYNIADIIQYLDLINIMTYDFHGLWDSETGINSPLYSRPNSSALFQSYSIEASMKFWLSQGAPASKLSLGIPLYGRTFQLASTEQRGIGSPSIGGGNAGPYTRTAGFLGYMEFCEQKSHPWTYKWDDIQAVPYAYHADQWISYDDEQSVKLKVKFAKKYNLAAVMVWSIETDDLRNVCGQGKNPLLTALNVAWNGRLPSTTDTTTSTTTTTEVPPGDPDQCGTVSNRPHPICTKFWMCTAIGGDPVLQTCPYGLYFNQKLNVCDWPVNVDCKTQ